MKEVSRSEEEEKKEEEEEEEEEEEKGEEEEALLSDWLSRSESLQTDLHTQKHYFCEHQTNSSPEFYIEIFLKAGRVHRIHKKTKIQVSCRDTDHTQDHTDGGAGGAGGKLSSISQFSSSCVWTEETL
ncbi:hypothetical protein PAMP_016717 [Pampus punctatissimus]